MLLSRLCHWWRCIVRFFRSLWGRTTAADTDETAAREQLLGAQAPSSWQGSGNDAAASQSSLLSEQAADQPFGPTTLIVMRHGHRQDEEDSFWHQTAKRPWDPPLSMKGRVEAAAAAAKIGDLLVDYVISSPFKRCLQTSAGVVAGLGLSTGQWLVDWQLAEVCDARVLFGGQSELMERLQQQAVNVWMWGGLALAEALNQFVNQDCKLNRVGIKPLPRTTPLPHYPETLEQGLNRYAKALQEIAHSFAGKTVLLVTHGECVRQAVAMAEPLSEVFEVIHTGYVILQHTRQQASGPGGKPVSKWQITSQPGETGVLWLEDDD
eukprot:GHRR01016005.1.p1 GENE.GHRR01016005.1~~GHRR01016005.1.p1  ORF type:complete len:322 (+),score=98.43 GHRR01016005.1:3358-4323(+)